ncbi:MAG: hypothetical protein ACKVOO_10930 [Burkholderiaceae bacterium]
MFQSFLLVIACIAVCNSVRASPSQSFEGECGGKTFRVEKRNVGHPLENSYVLSVATPHGARRIYGASQGGWFHAACLMSRFAKPVVVFQSYCGGSACVEDKYGAIDPENLKLLFVPEGNNVSNSKKLSTLLGRPSPHLQSEKGRFCCE